jgi:hypothetical protein
MNIRVAALCLVACGLLTACDGDHGAMLVGDNQTDQELLARAHGNVWDNDSSHYDPTDIIVVLPANKRLVIAELPFAGGFEVQRVDILAPDCSQIGSLAVYGDQGTVVEIRDDLTVRLRDESPQSGEPAQTTDRCHAEPSASPSAPASPAS